MVFVSIRDTTHAASPILFQLGTTTLPNEKNDDRVKNLTFDLACDVISGLQIKFCYIFGKLGLGASTRRFRIENRSLRLALWQLSGGRNVLPPSADRVLKYLNGALLSERLSILLLKLCS